MTMKTDSRRACRARQESDQMCCHSCGLVWDMNDPAPPRCLSDRGQRRTALRNLRRRYAI